MSDEGVVNDVAPRTPCPDAETLAAYVDGRTGTTDRAALERHLVECADCRDLVGAAAELEGEGARETAPRRVKRWYVAGAGLLAAAAAIVLVVRMQTSVSEPYVAEMTQLMEALGKESHRPTIGRLTGAADYRPPAPTTRGPGDNRVSPELAIAAASVEKRAAVRTTAASEASFGVALLATHRPVDAVVHLERAVTLSPQNTRYLNDLSVAYIERGSRTNDARDFERAEETARRALDIDGSLPEPHFNLALALKLRGQREAAVAIWLQFESLERDTRWAQEARRHQDRP